MRPVTISLDSVTWEYAKKKTNFSSWVRDQLRSERNRIDAKRPQWKECVMDCGYIRHKESMYCVKCMKIYPNDDE